MQQLNRLPAASPVVEHTDLEANTMNPIVSPSASSEESSQSKKPAVEFIQSTTQSTSTRQHTNSIAAENQPRDGNVASISNMISKSTLTSLTNIKEIRLLQYVCCIVSLLACIYFTTIGYINVALQYYQICFLSTLTVALDADSWKKQRLFFAFTVIVAIGWSAAYQWAGIKYLDFTVYQYVFSIMCSFFFIGGMLALTYVAILATESKHVELDLLLYLASLNAICFFNNDDVFNNNLHMILDIRTVVLLYSCLYEPKQKIELLSSKSFVIICILIVICFILFAYMGPITDSVANILYCIMGSMMFYDARMSYEKFQSIISKRMTTANAEDRASFMLV
jgi:peptidoglycan/LPS O-acetylase OafA/YrhL